MDRSPPPLDLSRFQPARLIFKQNTHCLYKAYDRKLNTLVGVKQCHTENRIGLFDLKHEFRSLSVVQHPNIIISFDLNCVNRFSYFTMEWINGPDIFHAVRSKTAPLAVNYDLLRRLLVQCATAVHHIHRLGLLHRDLKTEHFLTDSQDRAVLIDFGLASPYPGRDHCPDTPATVSGTFAFMSPEALAGRPLAPASDWYSFGVMLFECLTGKLPGAPFERSLESKTAFPPSVPPDLACITRSLLTPDPQQRPGGDEIIKTLAHNSPPFRPPPPTPQRKQEALILGENRLFF